jgi:hypothetical protein
MVVDAWVGLSRSRGTSAAVLVPAPTRDPLAHAGQRHGGGGRLAAAARVSAPRIAEHCVEGGGGGLDAAAPARCSPLAHTAERRVGGGCLAAAARVVNTGAVRLAPLAHTAVNHTDDSDTRTTLR